MRDLRASESVVQRRKATQNGPAWQEAGVNFVASQRSNSARLHRPWRASLRRSTLQQPLGAPLPT
jgi:hypothetical protein